MNDRNELRAFVAQFPELARRVIALNESAERDGARCLSCYAFRCDGPCNPGCLLANLRAVVRETEFQEALNRG